MVGKIQIQIIRFRQNLLVDAGRFRSAENRFGSDGFQVR